MSHDRAIQSHHSPPLLLLATIPVDVLEHKIFSMLSCSSLVACLLICRRLQRVASRVLLLLLAAQHQQSLLETRSKRPRYVSKQSTILLSLFEEGAAIPLLQWFQTRLRYPVFPITIPTITTATAMIGTTSNSTIPEKQQQTIFLECAALAAKGTCI